MDDFSPVKPGNVPEMSVSELAFSLKRTLEETYGRVRVRGELSKVKIHSSGHLYSDLKDQEAVLNIICWRGTLARLNMKPEEGMEVTCTGKITSYPARSNYQMVVEMMEPAGEGALLKMLEERRKRLAAEGLFDAARKKKLPLFPRVIGVVTSPTGAVIKDILHRLADRFPCHVLLWPVKVQGAGAEDEIAAAIQGFNALERSNSAGPNHGIPRPDLLIVARGGGSLEDLMCFNDEKIVRAVANSAIPIISAVGHETDTTLIDYAADMRAPTPTAAAEMATPDRLSLIETLRQHSLRLGHITHNLVKTQGRELDHMGKRLGDPQRLLALAVQRLDQAHDHLFHVLERRVSVAEQIMLRLFPRLIHPREKIAMAQKNLDHLDEKLRALTPRLLKEREKEIEKYAKILEILSFKSVLGRGFALVRNEQGEVVSSIGSLTAGKIVEIELKDGRCKTKIEEIVRIA